MKLSTELLTLALAATAAASPTPASKEVALFERQFNLPPRCPNNYPLVRVCRQWQIDECVERATHPVCWPERETPEACLNFCTAGAATLCTTRCYSEMPNPLIPIDTDTPWPFPADGCPAEGPEYTECYDSGVEWCLSTPYIQRLFCQDDCPEFCHQWMDKGCRRACNVQGGAE